MPRLLPSMLDWRCLSSLPIWCQCSVLVPVFLAAGPRHPTPPPPCYGLVVTSTTSVPRGVLQESAVWAWPRARWWQVPSQVLVGRQALSSTLQMSLVVSLVAWRPLYDRAWSGYVRPAAWWGQLTDVNLQAFAAIKQQGLINQSVVTRSDKEKFYK